MGRPLYEEEVFEEALGSPRAVERLEAAARYEGPSPEAMDAYLDEREQQRLRYLGRILSLSARTDPDKEGGAQELAEQANVPVALAREKWDDVKAAVESWQKEAGRIERSNPILAEKLRDPEFAAIAHDDLRGLSAIETLFLRARQNRRQWRAGRKERTLGDLYQLEKWGVATDQQLRSIAEIEAEIQEAGEGVGFIQKSARIAGQMSTMVPEAVRFGGVSALGTMGMTAAWGAALPFTEEGLTVPAAAAIGMGAGTRYKMGELMYRMEAGLEWGEMKGQDITGLPAVIGSEAYGLASAFLELAGIEFMAAPFKKVVRQSMTRTVAKKLQRMTLGRAAARGGLAWLWSWVGETGTEEAQELLAITAEEVLRALDKDLEPLMKSEEGRRQIADRLVETFVQAGMGMALLSLPGGAVTFLHDAAAARRADAEVALLDGIALQGEESKSRRRNPTRWGQFVQAQADQARGRGLEVQNVYIPADRFAAALEQVGSSRDDLARDIPEIEERLREAEQAGAPGTGDVDVVIPIGEYAARVSGTKLGDALRTDTRLDPAGKSLREAQQFQGLREKLRAQASEAIREQREKNHEFEASARRLKRRVFGEIRDTGMYAAREARAAAEAVHNYVVVMAAEENVLPEEWFEQHGVRFGERQSPMAADLFDEEGRVRTESEGFRQWFGKSAMVDEEGKPRTYHPMEMEGEERSDAPAEGERSASGMSMEVEGREPGEAPARPPGAVPWLGDAVYLLGSSVPTPRPVHGDQYVRLENPYRMSREERGALREKGSEAGRERMAELIEAGHDGVIVEGTQEVVAFDPTAVKPAQAGPAWEQVGREVLEQRARAEDRAWLRWTPPKTEEGKFKGAPEWIKTDQDVTKVKRLLRRLVDEGLAGRWWYEDTAETVLRYVQNDVVKAEKFIELLAIYSSNNHVWGNTLAAVRAYTHWAMGRPAADLKVLIGRQDKSAVDVLYNDKPWAGRKTNSFYNNLMHLIAERFPDQLHLLKLDQESLDAFKAPVTVDVWLYRAFGYRRAVGRGDKESGRYSFCEGAIREVTARLNLALPEGAQRWMPHQVQACMWTAMKTRYYLPEVLSKTIDKSRKGNLIKREGRRVIYPPAASDAYKNHMWNWRQTALKAKQADVIAAVAEQARGFAEDMVRMTDVVTWEALPARTLGYPINQASVEAIREFTVEAMRLLTDENGNDLLAAKLGVALAFMQPSAGAFEGNVEANVLSHILPARARGAKGFSQEEVRIYCRAMQYITMQNAVPWMRAENSAMTSKAAQDAQKWRVVNPETGQTLPGAIFDTQAEAERWLTEKREATRAKGQAVRQAKPSKAESWQVRGGPLARAMVFRFPYAIRHGRLLRFLKALQRALGEDAGYTQTAADEIMVVNYRGDSGVPFALSDEGFVDALNRLVQEEGGLLDLEGVYALWTEAEDGPEEEWGSVADSAAAVAAGEDEGILDGSLQGEEILNSGTLAGRPDLQAWLRDRHRAFLALLDRYSGDSLAEIERAIQESRDLAERGRGADRGTGTDEGGAGLGGQRDVQPWGREDLPGGQRLSGDSDVLYQGALRTADEATGEFLQRHELVELHDRELGADRVSTPAEAAQAVAYLSEGTVERFDALVTDAEGRPLAIVGSFKGAESTGTIYLSTIVGEAFRVAGAANIWFVHNHPGIYVESIQLSPQDKSMYTKLVEIFRGSSIQPRAMIAIAASPTGQKPWQALQREYDQASIGPWVPTGTVPSMPVTLTEGTTSSPPAATMTVPVVERRFAEYPQARFGPIRTTFDELAYVKQFAAGRSGLLLLDGGGNVVGFAEVQSGEASPLRDTDRMNDLYRALSISATERAIIVADDLAAHEIQNLARFLETGGYDALDVVTQKDDRSWQAEGKSLGTGTFLTGPRAAPRGLYDPVTRTISLGEATDVSTLMHELSHWFLDTTLRVASQADAPARIVADVRTLLDWWGIADLATWSRMSLDEQRRYHERFAYSFETYLWEGAAPSTRMRAIFARISSWMRLLYKSLRGISDQYREAFGEDLPVLTPEVRGVFDRMLASQEEIAYAEKVRGLVPVYQTQEESGMNDGEWAAYQQMQAEHRDEAVAEMTRRSLHDMRWLGNAKSAILRRMQEEEAEVRREVREKVASDVGAMPIFRAIRFFRTGQSENAAGEPVQAAAGYKLSISSVARVLPDEKVRRELGYGRYGMLARDGMDVEVAAELFGFRSGEEMVRVILGTPIEEQVVEEMTDQRMLAAHSQMMDPQVREQLVEEALQNEYRTMFAGVELRHMLKIDQPLRLIMEAARQIAEDSVAEMKVSRLRPRVHALAEDRAARMALSHMQARDEAAAGRAKQNQIVQQALVRAVTAAKQEYDRALKLFAMIAGTARDKQRAQSRNMDLVYTARAILALYGFSEKGRSPQDHLAQLKAYDPDAYDRLLPIVDQAVDAAQYYGEMTVRDFRLLRDMVQGLWDLAERQRRVRVQGQLQALEYVASEILDRLDEIGIPGEVPGERGALTSRNKLTRLLQEHRARLRRVEHWCDAVDGPVTDPGPFMRYIWRLVRDATTRFKSLRNEYVRRVVELIEELDLPEGEIPAKKLGYTFKNKAHLLGAMLHNGTWSNLYKLVGGYKWGEIAEDGIVVDTTRWDAFVERMEDEGVITKADWDFCQAIWNLNEEIKPIAQQAHKELYGFYFPEIAKRRFTTRWGEYEGGYVPARPDRDVARKGRVFEKLEQLEADVRNSYPHTGMGFTKSREERYKDRLALDLRLTAKHIDDALRYAIVQPAVADVMRILRERSVYEALWRIDPAAVDELLIPWLQTAARQAHSKPGMVHPSVDRFFHGLRTRAGTSVMFGNLRVALQQLTGIFPAAIKVAPRYLKTAVLTYWGSPRAAAEAIAEMSPFMDDRLHNQILKMRETMDNLVLHPNQYQQLQKWGKQHGYFMQAAFQNHVDLLTWIGAFNQALAEQNVHAEARKIERDADGKARFTTIAGQDAAAVAEAVERADSAVRLTQDSFDPEDTSQHFLGSEFMKAVTQFTSYFNMTANLMGTGFVKVARDLGWRGNLGQLFYIYLFGFALPMLVAEGIVMTLGGDWDDDDEDGYLDVWMEWFLGGQLRGAAAMIPGGPQAMVVLNARDGKTYNDRITVSPSISILENAVVGTLGGTVSAILDEDREMTGKNVRDAITLLSLIAFPPGAVAGRVGGYAWDVGRGEVEPTSGWDLARGLITGKASMASRR